ncbi:MAG: hypothetical protein AB1762_21775 [Gemmatimonadota bacterium]
MKKLYFLAAAALVALGTSAANAQDTTRKDTTRKEARGDVVAMPSVPNLILAIEASPGTVAKFSSFKPMADKIQVIDVATFATAPTDGEAIKAAVEKNKDGISKLQDELKKHEVVTTALSASAAKPEPGDVVAAEIQDDRLVLYVWKK